MPIKTYCLQCIIEANGNYFRVGIEIKKPICIGLAFNLLYEAYSNFTLTFTISELLPVLTGGPQVPAPDVT